jgi:hypothetical protein
MYFEKAICPPRTPKTQKKELFPKPVQGRGQTTLFSEKPFYSVKPSKKSALTPRPEREAVSVQFNVHFYNRVFTEPVPPV